jgi:hypothetical protein
MQNHGATTAAFSPLSLLMVNMKSGENAVSVKSVDRA